MRALLPVTLLLIACGCDTLSQSQSGNFGRFLTSAVEHYGGHASSTKSLPNVKTTWTTASDENGFKIWLNSSDFAAIDSLLRQAYGAPVNVETNANGTTGSLFKTVNAEVDIQLFREGNTLTITCLPESKKRGGIQDNAPSDDESTMSDN